MADFAKWVASTNLSKAYKDDAGKMHVTAIVSDSLTDLDNDQMSYKALQGMVEQFKKGVDLIDNHRSTFGFGRTVDANLIMDKDKNGQAFWKVMVDVELDNDSYEAKTLYNEVSSGTCKKQLSIGGTVPHKEKDALGVTFDKGGRMVRQVNKVELDHLACTRKDMAANPRTSFVNAIMKSLDELKAFDGVEPDSVESEEKCSDNKSVESKETEELTKNVTNGTQFLAQIGQMVKNGGSEMAKLLKDITEEETSTPVSTEGNEFPLDGVLAEDDGQMLEDQVAGDQGMDTEFNEGVVEDAEVVPVGGEVASSVDVPAIPAVEDAGDTMLAGEEEVGKGMEELQNAPEEGEVEDYDIEAPSQDDIDLEAAKILAEKRLKQKMLEKKKSVVNFTNLLTEIQMLAQNTSLSKGLEPKKAKLYDLAITKALMDVRYVLADKVLMTKEASESVKSMARIIKEQGPFAPGGDFMDANDDKAYGSTDVASTNVTGADKQPKYADSAESAKGAAGEPEKVMTNAINEMAKLPQQGEDEKFGKSLKMIQAENNKLLKNVTEQLAKGFDEKLHSLQEVITSQSKTIENLINTPGISKSRNRTRMDIVKSTSEGTFTGLFGKAIDRANSKM